MPHRSIEEQARVRRSLSLLIERFYPHLWAYLQTEPAAREAIETLASLSPRERLVLARLERRWHAIQE